MVSSHPTRRHDPRNNDDDDDILTEKLQDYDHNGTHLEDDMEDITSIPVSKQLLRPSRSNLNQPSASSRSATPSFDPFLPYEPPQFQPPPMTTTTTTRQQDEHLPYPPPPQQHTSPSKIPRSKSQSSLTMLTSSQHLKKGNNGLVPMDVDPSSSSSDAAAIGRGYPRRPNKGHTMNGNGNSGVGDDPDDDIDDNDTDGGGTWEVLQTGTSGGTTSNATSRSVSAPLAMPSSSSRPNENIRFPASSSPPQSTPMANRSKSTHQQQRSRAQTNNLRTTADSSPISTTKSTATTSTTSKPSNTTPRRRAQSTSASKALGSTATTTTRRESGRDEAPTDIGPLPPWAQSTPMVFRNENTGELLSTGRIDQLVLPAVARKLEAARLAAMGMNDQDLIHHWGPDGHPREYSTVPLANRRQPTQSSSSSTTTTTNQMRDETSSPTPLAPIPPTPTTITSTSHNNSIHSNPPTPTNPNTNFQTSEPPLNHKPSTRSNQLRPKNSFASLSVVPSAAPSPGGRISDVSSGREQRMREEQRGWEEREKLNAKEREKEREREGDQDAGCCKCAIM